MIMSLDKAVGEIMTAFDGMNYDNIPTQYGSNPDNNFQFGSEDQVGQEESKCDGFFSCNEPAQKVVQGESKTHNSAKDRENSEDTGSHEDIKDSGDIEVSEDVEDFEDLEDLVDLINLEDLEDTEDAEAYQNIKAHKKNVDQKVDKNLEKNGNQSDKAEVININMLGEVNSVENNDRAQGYLGDLKTLEIQIEQQIDGKNTMPESGHKIDKENHVKNNQEPRPLPEGRLVRRDSSETEALYKEAATKKDIANAFSSSPKVDHSNLTSIQAASKVGSPTPTPKRTSGLGWSTWGLSTITLGIFFAFFAAICTVVERKGYF